MTAPITIDEIRRYSVIPVWSDDPDAVTGARALGLSSEAAAYRAANQWERSGGLIGLPVIRVHTRRLACPVPLLLRVLGAVSDVRGETPAALSEPVESEHRRDGVRRVRAL